MKFLRSWLKRSGASLLIGIGLFAWQGCATAPERTDFIQGSIDMRTDPNDHSLLWWERPDFSWHNYSKIMMDPVEIRMVQDVHANELTPQDLEQLSLDLGHSVAQVLAPEYPIVQKPGKEVLRIRAAITEIDLSSPVLNLVSTLVLFMPLDIGGASIEVEFLDSLSGERLAAMADRKRGSPLQLIGSLRRMGHARTAFEDWAEELKLALIHNP